MSICVIACFALLYSFQRCHTHTFVIVFCCAVAALLDLKASLFSSWLPSACSHAGTDLQALLAPLISQCLNTCSQCLAYGVKAAMAPAVHDENDNLVSTPLPHALKLIHSASAALLALAPCATKSAELPQVCAFCRSMVAGVVHNLGSHEVHRRQLPAQLFARVWTVYMHIACACQPTKASELSAFWTTQAQELKDALLPLQKGFCDALHALCKKYDRTDPATVSHLPEVDWHSAAPWLQAASAFLCTVLESVAGRAKVVKSAVYEAVETILKVAAYMARVGHEVAPQATASIAGLERIAAAAASSVLSLIPQDLLRTMLLAGLQGSEHAGRSTSAPFMPACTSHAPRECTGHM